MVKSSNLLQPRGAFFGRSDFRDSDAEIFADTANFTCRQIFPAAENSNRIRDSDAKIFADASNFTFHQIFSATENSNRAHDSNAELFQA